MDVPGPWRPLKIKGTFAGGTMVLGRGPDVVMQLKWWRPKLRRFRPARWLDRRLRSMKARMDDQTTCPSPDGFETVARAVRRPVCPRGSLDDGAEEKDRRRQHRSSPVPIQSL